MNSKLSEEFEVLISIFKEKGLNFNKINMFFKFFLNLKEFWVFCFYCKTLTIKKENK